MCGHVLVKQLVNDPRHGITLHPTSMTCRKVHDVTKEFHRWVIHDVNMVQIDQLLLKDVLFSVIEKLVSLDLGHELTIHFSSTLLEVNPKGNAGIGLVR